MQLLSGQRRREDVLKLVLGRVFGDLFLPLGRGQFGFGTISAGITCSRSVVMKSRAASICSFMTACVRAAEDLVADLAP